MYHVFYAVPASYTFWQDSLQRFDSLPAALVNAATHKRGQVRDASGNILYRMERMDPRHVQRNGKRYRVTFRLDFGRYYHHVYTVGDKRFSWDSTGIGRDTVEDAFTDAVAMIDSWTVTA